MANQAKEAVRLYDRDFYLWAKETAAALQRGDFASIDLSALIDEVEDLARHERRAMRSRLEQLLLHLLKWKYQPERRGKSWAASIREQRLRLAKLVQENPSLRSQLCILLDEAYPISVLMAVRQTEMPESVFPEQCPFTLAETLSADLV